jgi:hypothetical protein
VDFKQVTESGAFPYDLIPSDCIGFLRVITCGKCIMGGEGTLLGVLYKVRLLMCTDNINTLFVRRSLQSETSYVYGNINNLFVRRSLQSETSYAYE